VFTKTHLYYEPAESGPQFLTFLSTLLFIRPLVVLSTDTAVSKLNGHVLKRLEFDSRKRKFSPAASKFIVSRPVPVLTKRPVQRMWRFFTFEGRSGAEVMSDVLHLCVFMPSRRGPCAHRLLYLFSAPLSDLPTKIL